MAKTQVFRILAAAFLGGIFFRSFGRADFPVWIFSAVLSAIIIGTAFYRRPRMALASGALIFFALGIWRFEAAEREIGNRSGAPGQFSGRVRIIKEPEDKGDYQKISAKIADGELEGIRIIFNQNRLAAWEYGDEINLTCSLEVPENRNGKFDYQMYLAKDGISYGCRDPIAEGTGRNAGDPVYKYLLRIKHALADNIDRTIPQPEGALAKGLIFGGSSELPKAVSENFSRTGMTHIVAVSGYNVTIIAEYLILFGIWIGLWRRQAFWFAISGIGLFVLLVGFPSSAVRAGVMGSLLLWAMKNGRLANSTNAILCAAAAMLLLNPLLLRYDIGFQLSFLATIGIVRLAPLLERYAFDGYDWMGWQGIIILTLSAQLFVTPIIMFHFGTFSAISLLANLLILPVIPISMLLVFLASIAGSLSHHLALPFAWLAFLPLKYEVGLVNALGRWNWSSAQVSSFHWSFLVAWYVVLIFVIFKLERGRPLIESGDAK